jgi:hypothetical protein
VAGAWETFFDQQNADAWQVYDYADDTSYLPEWDGTANGYAYSTYTEDYPLAIYADSLVGNGAFTGDFQGQNISGVSCDVFIGDLAVLDLIDCAVLADGPVGTYYYYNLGYLAEDFDGGGWWTLNFSFDEPWYYNDPLNPNRQVAVDPRTLTKIQEVNISFFPLLGTSGGSRVGIDNVILEPTVAAPKLATSVASGTPGNFRLAFTPGPGVQCRVDKFRTAPATGWDAVVGQTGIKGPGEHVMLRPLTPPAELFRVVAEPFYTAIVTP